jgi:YVTN family beta-propeller protein
MRLLRLAVDSPIPAESMLPNACQAARRKRPVLLALQKAFLTLIILSAIIGSISCHRRVIDPPPLPYLAFVANQHGRSVAVVDLARFNVLASLAVAPDPDQVVVRPRSQEVYVVSTSGLISVIGFPDLRVIKSMRVGRSAGNLVFSPDGRLAYLLEPGAGQIVFIDCEQGREAARLRVGPNLSNLALTPDGKTLIAADGNSGNIYFISVDSRKVLGSILAGKGPGPMGILPDSSKVFIALAGENKISVVNVASRQFLSNLELGSTPSALIVKPDGGEIFVLSFEGATITVLDAFHDNVELSFTTGRQPAAAALRRDASVLYIASAADGNIIALDAPNRTVLPPPVHVGISPRALTLTPDERYLVVADSGSSSLAILRTDRNELVTTIPVGDLPVDVAVPDWLRK